LPERGGLFFLLTAFPVFTKSSYNEWRTDVSLPYFFDSIINAGEFLHS